MRKSRGKEKEKEEYSEKEEDGRYNII